MTTKTCLTAVALTEKKTYEWYLRSRTVDGESLHQVLMERSKRAGVSGEIHHNHDHYLIKWRNKAGVETEWKLPHEYTDDELTTLLVTMRLTC